jgi:hypothetical protein
VCNRRPGTFDELLELGAARAARPVLRGAGGGDTTSLPNQIRSASVRTEVKDVMTRLVKWRRSPSNAMGGSFCRGMSSVPLAFKRHGQDRVFDLPNRVCYDALWAPVMNG